MRLFIAEDEAASLERVRRLLDREPDVQLVGSATSGDAAFDQIVALRPDVLLLDVAMPDRTGLEIVQALPYHPIIIFITAFDRHAVTAFELAAIDYVLKPFDDQRFATAIDRARRVLDLEDGSPTSPVVDTTAQRPTSPLSRFFVRERAQLAPVHVRDVERLEADDDYVKVYVERRVHLVCLSLDEFERRLDPGSFLRIHRSHIVNLDFVTHVLPFDGSRLMVQMRSGAKLVASRARSKRLRDLTL